MSETRRALMSELVKLQNENNVQDILTITAFMNDEQLAAHVERNRKEAK